MTYDDRVAQYYLDNPDVSVEDVAKHFFMTVQCMYNILARTGTKTNRSNRNTVTIDDLVAGRNGMGIVELAEKFGISISTVHRRYKDAGVGWNE